MFFACCLQLPCNHGLKCLPSKTVKTTRRSHQVTAIPDTTKIMKPLHAIARKLQCTSGAKHVPPRAFSHRAERQFQPLAGKVLLSKFCSAGLVCIGADAPTASQKNLLTCKSAEASSAPASRLVNLRNGSLARDRRIAQNLR